MLDWRHCLMLTSGRVKLQGTEMDVFCWHNEHMVEVCLAKDNIVVSAYKSDYDTEYMFIDTKARQIASLIKKAINKKVSSKKITTCPFKLGIMDEYQVTLSGGFECAVNKHKGLLVGLYIIGGDVEVDMVFMSTDNLLPKNIAYVRLTKVQQYTDEESGEKRIPVRTLEEIALEKDVSWLKEKKYFIVQDAVSAERIFRFLENYDGPISYDTETTGLRINCFSKYGSVYMSDLAQYNKNIDAEFRGKVDSGDMTEAELEDKKIRSDTLTGIIFCWKPNEAYYFPCGNRLFENLYENRNDDFVKQIIKWLRDKKKVDDPNAELESTQYFNSCTDEEVTCDFILMDRCRDILQNKHLVAHNGPFEWKVGYMYDIITNIKDDTMILHQIMYKFKDTSRNSGENSSLKYLVNKEFGVDQLELSDFFAGYSDEGPEIKGSKRKKKKGYRVDFSYMDYRGSKAYAPADGDFTLQLFYKYKKDLVENYKELEYIYNIEVVTSCAIAYMEFYGHRIDESKINGAREDTLNKCKELEAQIRELAGLAPTDELNIASPAQMAKLFFETLEIPFKGEKPSVAKKELKQYLKLKDADGNPQYPIINAYSEWKKADTLLTKFFDNLQNFMYPGGFIFSHYKQIETGTGRMSCNGPNAQQYPKVVTAMVSPRKNCVFFDADYSQIEYRVLTALAKEKNLMDMFKDPDTDYHTLMASRMYGVDYSLVTPQMRSDAKSFNFGIPYGMGFGSLAILLRGANTPEFREEAMEKYELYFKDQPNVRQFFDDVKEAATINKYTRTEFNRRRYYRFTDKDGNYSSQAKGRALRQAGNAVIQGTAADVFKIAMARVYTYIRRNKLFGKVYITNMVHDEGLYEIDVSKLNPKAIMRDIVNCMQFKIDGYPPLFVGGGFGTSWKDAKGKDAEIHPVLSQNIANMAASEPVNLSQPLTVEEVISMFDGFNFEFRKQKISDYLCDSNNFHKALHPVIGNLLNTFFSFGIPEDEEDRTLKILARFIEEYNLPISAEMYRINDIQEDIEEEEGYEDEDEENDEDAEGQELGYSEFALLDESDKAYGVDLVELIDLFGYMISKNLGVCGIDIRGMRYTEIERVSNYLEEHAAIEGDDINDCLEVVLLTNNNILNRTGYYVKDIEGSAIAKIVKSKSKKKPAAQGTIEERLEG